MDRPRHPIVTRTWKQRRPVTGVPHIKRDSGSGAPVQGVAEPPKPRKSNAEKKERRRPE